MPFTTVEVTAPIVCLPVASGAASDRRGLRRAVDSALDRGARQIVIDCAAWRAEDLVMLSTLIGCASLCAERGAAFQLENLDGATRDAVHQLHLGQRLGLHLEN